MDIGDNAALRFASCYAFLLDEMVGMTQKQLDEDGGEDGEADDRMVAIDLYNLFPLAQPLPNFGGGSGGERYMTHAWPLSCDPDP